MTDKITFSNSFGEKYHMPVNGAHTMRVGSKSPKTKLTVEQHDPRCAVVRSGDLRAWCDCCQGMTNDTVLEDQLREAARVKDPSYARIEQLNEQLKTVLQREADTQRRHDEKVERLEEENERLRRDHKALAKQLDISERKLKAVTKLWYASRSALGETK